MNYPERQLAGALVVGLVLGALIGWVTAAFTVVPR